MQYKKHSISKLYETVKQAEQLLNKRYSEKMRAFENKANPVTVNNDTFFEEEENNNDTFFEEEENNNDTFFEETRTESTNSKIRSSHTMKDEAQNEYDGDYEDILKEYPEQLKRIEDENSKSRYQFKNEKRDMNETTISLNNVAQKLTKAQDSLALNREKFSKLSNIEDSLVLNKERLAKKLDQPDLGRY